MEAESPLRVKKSNFLTSEATILEILTEYILLIPEATRLCKNIDTERFTNAYVINLCAMLTETGILGLTVSFDHLISHFDQLM